MMLKALSCWLLASVDNSCPPADLNIFSAIASDEGPGELFPTKQSRMEQGASSK